MRLLVVAAIGLALLAGSARAAGPPVLGFSISTGAQVGLQHVSLPSASAPNAPGAISVPVSFTSPPASPQQLSLSALHVLWQQAGAAYGIPWQVLASINKIESNFGQNMGPSSAGAVGWMQFMPSTWLRWGVDGDGDGIADPWNATDAVYAAARYLAAAGGQTDISRGVFAYNHADWYVREVLDLARVYGQGGITQTVDLQQIEAKLDGARRKVVPTMWTITHVQLPGWIQDHKPRARTVRILVYTLILLRNLVHYHRDGKCDSGLQGACILLTTTPRRQRGLTHGCRHRSMQMYRRTSAIAVKS